MERKWVLLFLMQCAVVTYNFHSSRQVFLARRKETKEPKEEEMGNMERGFNEDQKKENISYLIGTAEQILLLNYL